MAGITISGADFGQINNINSGIDYYSSFDYCIIENARNTHYNYSYNYASHQGSAIFATRPITVTNSQFTHNKPASTYDGAVQNMFVIWSENYLNLDFFTDEMVLYGNLFEKNRGRYLRIDAGLKTFIVNNTFLSEENTFSNNYNFEPSYRRYQPLVVYQSHIPGSKLYVYNNICFGKTTTYGAGTSYRKDGIRICSNGWDMFSDNREVEISNNLFGEYEYVVIQNTLIGYEAIRVDDFPNNNLNQNWQTDRINSGYDLSNLDYNFPSTDVYGNPRKTGTAIDIGAVEAFSKTISVNFEYEPNALTADNYIDFGNVNATTGKEVTATLINEGSEAIHNISYSLSEDLQNGVYEISNLPTELDSGAGVTIKFKFFPDQMFKRYDGSIYINSSDEFFPKLEISVKGLSTFSINPNWVSLPFPYQQQTQVMKLLGETGGIGTEIIDQSENIMRYLGEKDGWITENGFVGVNPASGYIVTFYEPEEYCDIVFSDEGIGGEVQNPLFDIPANVEVWLGYPLTEKNSIDGAFGKHFNNIDYIMSDSWCYQNGSLNLIDPASTPLHYGKMYKVKFLKPVSDFMWSEKLGITSKEIIYTPKKFSYTTTKSYEAINVFGLPDNAVEVGAFVGETCIGAGVVKENSCQILAYTSELTPSRTPITLAIATNEGITRGSNDFLVYNKDLRKYEEASIIANKNKITVVNFDLDKNNINKPVYNVANYPNPFNPETTISYSLSIPTNVEVSVYNVKGQKVKTLINEEQLPGKKHVIWKGKNSNGNKVASGVYFYKVKTNNKTITKKMLLLK